MKPSKLFRIRLILVGFVIALAASGITAFALPPEVRLLKAWFGPGTAPGETFPGMSHWLCKVSDGLEVVDRDYPFLAYGTDWLAFAHLIIAVSFIGPIRDPVRNIWGVEFGMIACLALIALALICGPIRGIPWFWQAIDCSFGVFGMIPLWIVWRMIRSEDAAVDRQKVLW
ncbi:MAG: hypothetical protein ABSG53_24850 [Thermoguttaceae bacterium]|jgi:hypothetical protein